MGKLFDNLPRRFFNPLSALSNGGNQQQFYAECMLVINSLFADRTQVSREDLKDEIVNLLLADHIQSIDETDISETSGRKASVFSGAGVDSAGEQGQSPEERMANHVISYLSDEEVGWIEEGIDSRTYSRTYMITEQGMMLADYIQRASAMKLDELSNYLYNTYLALDDFTRHRKERENNNPYTLVIVNAYTNIKALASSLKMLRRSIRRIVQKVTGKLTFQELMDNLGDYIDGDFIGEFTRLVNSENASLFRGPITTMLKRMMDSPRTEEIFIRDCMKAGKEEALTWEGARVRVYEQVAFVEDFLTDGYLNIVRDIRKDAFDKMEHLPLSYIDSHSHGDMVSRIIADVDTFADGLLMGFTQLFTGIATIVGTLIFMLIIDVKITLVVVILTPLSLFVASFIAKKTYSMFQLQTKTRGEQTALIEEMVGNQKVVLQSLRTFLLTSWIKPRR